MVAAVGAGATAISAAFIAWQAYETRRAAQATRASAQETAESVELTRQALQISQDSLAVSRALAAEQMKGRLDARAPRLRVNLGTPEWPPLEPSVHGGQPNPIPPDFVFHQPRDDNR